MGIPWLAKHGASPLRIVLILALGIAVATPTYWYAVLAQESLYELTKESICGFVTSLYRDFGGFGCCVESPATEPDVCYTSTNLLAEHVLRTVCGRIDLADKVRAFLDRYSADFYDYYQILVSKPFTLPFVAVEHEQADVVDGVRVVHVKRTSTIIDDYHRYANLVVYKALYHMHRGELGEALEELDKLSTLFDGKGFADAYYGEHRKYESYKVALAVIAYKALDRVAEVEKYTSILRRVKPFATLYEGDFKGVGDLNLETACLTAIALYAEPISSITPIGLAYPEALPKATYVLLLAIPALVVAAVALYIHTLRSRRRRTTTYRRQQIPIAFASSSTKLR